MAQLSLDKQVEGPALLPDYGSGRELVWRPLVWTLHGVDTVGAPRVLSRVPAASLQSLINKAIVGHSKGQAEALDCP